MTDIEAKKARDLAAARERVGLPAGGLSDEEHAVCVPHGVDMARIGPSKWQCDACEAEDDAPDADLRAHLAAVSAERDEERAARIEMMRTRDGWKAEAEQAEERVRVVVGERDALAARVHELEKCVSAVCNEASRVLAKEAK